MKVKLIILLSSILWACDSTPAEKKTAKGEKEPYKLETNNYKFRLVPRTPNQMAAFYIGRGFVKPAVEAVKDTCYITAVMRNLSNQVVWLELDNWRFITKSGEIKRLDRKYWHAKWDELNIPQAQRSTFGWTLMPEVRDLRPDEPVGGNIVLSPSSEKFTLEARFKTGEDKQGKEWVIRVENVQCIKD